MKREIELLAPGGDVDSIKAAITAGADAVYCGLNRFNARNRATNITISDLIGIISLAHNNGCKVFLTINVIIVGSEIPSLIKLLNSIVNTDIDGVIVQDLGVFYLLDKYFNSLQVHASTQFTTHNKGQIAFLSKLNVARVNLSRELNLGEIKTLTSVSHQKNIETEVFVHGSYCIGFSGLCYLSSVHSGNSGNRGRCSQPCRDRYRTTPLGKEFPLNLRDNSAYADLKKLYDTGVDSIKIEGRIKKYDYVYTVVKAWREQLERLYSGEKLKADDGALYKVFNRGFSSSFLNGDIHREMFVDDPRDSLNTLSENSQKEIYGQKDLIKDSVKKRIKFLSIGKNPLLIEVSGKEGRKLSVNLKTLESSFTINSDSKLVKNSDSKSGDTLSLSLGEKFKIFKNTNYYLEHLDLENLDTGLFLPFKDIASVKKKIIFLLNGSKEFVHPVEKPFLKKQKGVEPEQNLSVLISSEKDLDIKRKSTTDIIFQIPGSVKSEYIRLKNLFNDNRDLIPLFPPVLIGEDFSYAVKLMEEVKPELLVTNNTGIGYEAYNQGIKWIAGPYLNVVNSYSLLCLKERFNCNGAFISNEINRVQLKTIIKPDNFKLYYSICHPILLLSSRQCLFHQVTGCEKEVVDGDCLKNCKKSTSITDLKDRTTIIEKSRGNYHNLYNDKNYLNTDVVKDFKEIFSDFSIDLRSIKTHTETKLDKSEMVELFEDFLDGKTSLEDDIRKAVSPTTKRQYKKGI